MTHGSLFSGIGGFDLAAEWMGWKNLFHCEWNEFGQKVLKYYWPDAELFTDITKSNFTKYANKIDILTGGFPCQPYSQAGKRLGKDDERHLWPEMLRVIREVKPTYIVGENVRGLTNWNGGVVFEEVCVDLENCGYQVQPVLLPACAVNAPHRRDRVWFVAYCKSKSSRGELQQQQRKRKFGRCDCKEYASDTNCNGQHECNSEYEINTSEGGINAFGDIEQINVTNTKSIGQKYALENGELERRRFRISNKRNIWDSFPSVSPICNGDDGISDRLDSITFPKWRNESIKAGGNAIVPQVAYQIFKTIEHMELLIK